MAGRLAKKEQPWSSLSPGLSSLPGVLSSLTGILSSLTGVFSSLTGVLSRDRTSLRTPTVSYSLNWTVH